MPKLKVILATIVAVVTIAVVTIAVAPLADESKPPAVRAAAGSALGAPPLAASAASAGERDPQGGERSLAAFWLDPPAFGGLDFDHHPFLSAFVVVGTILAGLVITGRIRRGPDDGPEYDKSKAADGTGMAKKAPPRPETDPA